MDEFLHFYYAQVMHRLGDDGWEKMFPGSPKNERLTWSAYRRARFDFLVRTQLLDGSWHSAGTGLGPVYPTAVHLAIMQLDNTPLPLSR
jgi:hypothetical protein